ncbi:hypothetical protein PCE1_000889 [Barthelona sp. PCE]
MSQAGFTEKHVQRIMTCQFYREHCFGQSLADIPRICNELEYVGVYDNVHELPSPFFCCFYRLYVLRPTIVTVKIFVDSSIPYLRFLALLYIRVFGISNLFETIVNNLSVFLPLCYRSKEGVRKDTTIDELSNILCTKTTLYDDYPLPAVPNELTILYVNRTSPLSVFPQYEALLERFVEKERNIRARNSASLHAQLTEELEEYERKREEFLTDLKDNLEIRKQMHER